MENPILSTSKENKSNIKSMLGTFFLTVGALLTRNLLPLAEQLTALLLGLLTMYETARPPKKVWNIDRTRLGSFIMTKHWCPLLCQCSNFWPLIT
jgi:hypothetical protein